VGSHWTDIGFQGTDPSTDLRGAGMLGVLQLLYFVSEFPKTAKAILRHSQDSRFEFPLCVTYLEFSIMSLELMRSGVLYEYCNNQGEVIQSTCIVVVRLFVLFMQRYIENKMDVGKVSKQIAIIERAVKSSGLRKYLAM
jgi:hypothetical protein